MKEPKSKEKFNEREELIIMLNRIHRFTFSEIEYIIGVPDMTVNKIYFFEVLAKIEEIWHSPLLASCERNRNLMAYKYAVTEIGDKYGTKEQMLLQLKNCFERSDLKI